jgi:XRE family transcriptional regulator, regulator of sulfur utilization
VNAKPVPAAPAKRSRPSPDRLAGIVADRVKRLITRKGRTLEHVAEASGIDVDDLARIAAGEEAPTLHHLWRIANALGVPFGSLVAAEERQGVLVIRKRDPQPVGSQNGAFASRALFPYDCRRPVEFYHLSIGPNHIERSEAHAPGTKENIVVARGCVEIIVGKEPPVQLDEGDAVDFLADVPHSYRNLGVVPAALYVVMSYETSDDDDIGA